MATSEPTVIKLSEDEQAIMNEFNLTDDGGSQPNVSVPKRVVTTRPNIPSTVQHEMEAFTNPAKTGGQTPNIRFNGLHDEEEPSNGDAFPPFATDSIPQMMPSSAEEPDASSEGEKADLLNKLARLQKKGFVVNSNLDMYSSVEDLRSEYARVSYNIEVDQSVRCSRRILVACVTGIEFLNKRYNPLDVHLDGWSETVMESVSDYDEVFEELYNKYRTNLDVSPEVKLIMMLGGSAAMFHLTKSMFKNLKTPERAPLHTVAPTAPNTPNNERPEMQGPGIDLTRLMGALPSIPPPQPPAHSQTGPPEPPVVTSRTIHDTSAPPPAREDDDISDIVSVASVVSEENTRNVQVQQRRGRSKTRRNRTEVTL